MHLYPEFSVLSPLSCEGRGGNTKTQHGAHTGSPTPQSITGEALLMREQQMCTGLQELAHGTRPMSSLKYKGYNKKIQEKVFSSVNNVLECNPYSAIGARGFVGASA
jgi:hypothetical protein